MADSGDKQLVHGTLDVRVFQADHLHHSISGFFLEAAEKVEKALHLDKLSETKLYATVDVGTARVARTKEIKFHPQSTVWNESFRVYCAHTASSVTVSIKNQLPIGARVLGRTTTPVSDVLRAEPIDGWFDLSDDEGHKIHKAKIKVYLRFTDVGADPCWDAGIKLPEFSGLADAYFEQRTGCEVTLYQNSHLSSHFHPVIHLSNGRVYRPSRLWEDLYNAINGAKHFIYIAGWSVNVKAELVRDPHRMIPGAEGVTLGELLKRKADEGVAVLVMVWEDMTSIAGGPGLMNTHGKETNKFFEDSKVKCFLCPRKADPSLTAVQRIETDVQFTHHQKTVSLDAPLVGDDVTARRVVSFVGGIDLCGGRYDDEHHTLFRHLDTTYLHDFQQHNFPHADLNHGGPREPWHDAHSKLEGAVAWDVLANFEQRWQKQAPHRFSGCLLDVRGRPETFPPSSPVPSSGSESWNVQLFRSIDDASVVGFPHDKPAEAARLGLMSGKDVAIEQSIHSAYVEAIRRAKRFVYIENQYFMGGCASWKEDRDAGCLNLVPVEIALKIASKIRNGERFAAFIVTPMWPEGEPEGDTVQAILHWNRLTMEMMYGIVAQAIEEAGLEGRAHPCDYLNFFCVANREVRLPEDFVPPESPEKGTNYWRAQSNRRFLIYVHAKLMIVDDEYVIVGSANLNQRSLEGDRDTEIAQGSYQPGHLNSEEGKARGAVHGYRMSLWYEHFMSHCTHLSHVFVDAESLECVRLVRKIAENLWARFVGDEVLELGGHLLPFPVKVSAGGELTEMTGDGFFPDTKAPQINKKLVVCLCKLPLLSILDAYACSCLQPLMLLRIQTKGVSSVFLYLKHSTCNLNATNRNKGLKNITLR